VERVSRIIKNIILIFTVLIFALALYWFGISPLLAKIEFTAEQIKIKKAELLLIKTKVASAIDLEQTLHNAQATEQAATQIIPAQLSLEELYSQINSLTEASGFKVRQISADQTFQPFEKDHRLKYIAVKLEGNAYFPQMINFLDLVAKSNFLLQVENMDLSSISKGNKPRLHFKITFNAFEYSSDL
jgi:Tfp pilus assembly protein PilO